MTQVDANTPRQCSLDANVARCVPVCREHVLIEIALSDFPPSVPGQFLQLRCRPPDAGDGEPAEWPSGGFPSLADADTHSRQAYLRRPFSIADRWTSADRQDHLCVISRTVGVGTGWLEHLRAGDTLNVTGPLGRGFRIPADAGPLILIGGGVGIPPLLYLARQLHTAGRTNTIAVLGATTRTLLPVELRDQPAADGTPRRCVHYPADAEVPTVITTDDGSLGLRGRVTDGLDRWCRQPGAELRRALVLACGPTAMLDAVARQARAAGIACQLCIERNMGCGVGTCLSCVVRVRDATRPEGWRWALTCTEGPVFDRDDLVDCAPPPCA
jgi:dihydroorotate dehydrogenase electron transfer subunit